MKIKTPFHRIKYRVMSKTWSYRSFPVACKLWWEWDVLPWFKKLDYKHNEPNKPYYRWEKYLWKK